MDHANAFQDTNKFCKPPADGSTNGDPSCTQECFNALAMVETVCGDAKCDDSIAKMECSSFPQHKSAVYDKCTVANPSVFPPGDATTAAADDGTSTADDAATPAPDDDAAHAAKMEEFKKKFKREEMPPASEETPAPPATGPTRQQQRTGHIRASGPFSCPQPHINFRLSSHANAMWVLGVRAPRSPLPPSAGPLIVRMPCSGAHRNSCIARVSSTQMHASTL